MAKTDRNFISAKELLEIAIGFEHDSVEFYRMMQKGHSNGRVIDLLKLLEEQERDHERTLREFEPGPGPYEMLQYAPSFRLSMPVPKSNDPGFDELLDVAIEREIKSALIYERSAQMVSGKLQTVLQGLVEFEREHEYKLKDLRDYLHSDDRV
jgi:rubrerythrin